MPYAGVKFLRITADGISENGELKVNGKTGVTLADLR